MFELLEAIGSASVWPFWVPVLIWTGLAGVALFVLRRARRLQHPITGYRLRQALLLALPVSVLAAPWVPGLFPPAGAPVGPGPSPTDALMVPSVSGGIAVVSDASRSADMTLVLLGVAAVAILLLAVARLAVLATDLRQLRRLRQVARRVDDPRARRTLREFAERLGVGHPVELLEGPPDNAPMTFGALRPVILVPRSLLDAPGSLGPVLAHELVHIRRADYSWAIVDCLISAAFAYHPLVWLLRRGIERCRETSCDAEVVACGIVRPKPYAELLAHAHMPARYPMPAVAASMSSPSLTLKERLEAMKRFADTRFTSRQHTYIVLAAGAVCLIVALAGACANRGEEEARSTLSEPAVLSGGTHSAGASVGRLDYAYVEPESVGDTLTYRIPPPIGTGIQYYPEATEQEVMNKLKELSVQIQYLRERIATTREAMDARETRDQEHDYLSQRYELLRSMHAEHVRVAELTMLQYETTKRIREDSSG
ncbi:MAG: M56 family metallopeptidase [Gemmatimonadota bacterium]|nr:M56 family metallopeptidase [Gemmatimonadota bacterium]